MNTLILGPFLHLPKVNKKISLSWFRLIEVEQLIVTFLDKETAHIDALIAEKERMLDLLEEKRTALISQAVTGQISIEDMAV